MGACLCFLRWSGRTGSFHLFVLGPSTGTGCVCFRDLCCCCCCRRRRRRRCCLSLFSVFYFECDVSLRPCSQLCRYQTHGDAPLALFGAPLATDQTKLAATSSSPLVLNFHRSLEFFREYFASGQLFDGNSDGADVNVAEVLKGLTKSECNEHRDQALEELEACHSIYGTDFAAIRVTDNGGTSGSAGDISKITTEPSDLVGTSDRVLVLLRLPEDESAVSGQGFLHVVIAAPQQGEDAATVVDAQSKHSKANVHTVGVLYSNSSLTPAQVFYVNMQLAQHHFSLLPDSGLASLQYFLADFFVEISLDPILVDTVFEAAAKQLQQQDQPSATVGGAKSSKMGSNSKPKPSFGRKRVVNVFAESRPRNGPGARGGSKPRGRRRKHMPHLSTELLQESHDKVKANSAAFQEMTAIRQKLPAFAFRQRILDALETSRVILVCSAAIGLAWLGLAWLGLVGEFYGGYVDPASWLSSSKHLFCRDNPSRRVVLFACILS